METEHRTTAEPKLRNRNWRRCGVRDDLVIPHRALKAWVRMLGNPQAVFVRTSDQLPELTWRRSLTEFSMRNLAHLLRQDIVAHRVVNLGVGVVHRVTDTGGACRAGGDSVHLRERSREAQHGDHYQGNESHVFSG